MRFFLVILLLGCLTFLRAQQSCRVMFYNVENLFDIDDDPLTEDDEFTPWGNRHWTQVRYMDKLSGLAQVVDSVGGKDWPVLVGLAEVENRRVLEDLLEKTILSGARYDIIHQDSPDRRGIDVALLYRKDYFCLLRTEFVRLSFPEDTTTTREILYASGILDKDTLHFFVCHFPSMVDGKRRTEWKREKATSLLRHKVDSIWSLDTSAKILIMGDLNGKADSQARELLRAGDSDGVICEKELYNTGYYLLNKGYGSYRYSGRWQTLDHIIVSGNWLSCRSGWRAAQRLSVYSASFLLEEDHTHFGYKPFPTYRSWRYFGGYSDHLPVFLNLSKLPE